MDLLQTQTHTEYIGKRMKLSNTLLKRGLRTCRSLASACESEGVQACQRKPSSTGRSIPGRLLSVHWLRFTGFAGAPYLDAPDIETSPGGAATSVATRWNKYDLIIV